MYIGKKKIGIGTFSLVLCVFGIIFDIILGDIIFSHVGLRAWSNGVDGIHYVSFYSIIFFMISFILSYRFKNDFGTKFSKYVSMIIISITIISVPFLML